MGALRRTVADGFIPWSRDPAPVRSIFVGIASLFRQMEPTMEPNFVRPTPPAIVLYAAELLRLLIRARAVPENFKLRDDAAQGIFQLKVVTRDDSTDVQLPVELRPEECEQLVAEFIGILVDLNLSLPPDPKAKHTPTTLADGSADEILLGGDFTLDPGAKIKPASATLPRETVRVAAQSPECLRWNAAYALYLLGADYALLMHDAFTRNLAKYRRKGEQARALLAVDVLQRAHVISTSATAISDESA